MLEGAARRGPLLFMRKPHRSYFVVAAAVVASVATTAGALPQTRLASAGSPPVRPIAWAEAASFVERLEQALPVSLRVIPPSERPARWPGWLANRRKELAARVAQGDEDSVVNLLLFGTSFTKEPRVTSSLLQELDQRWKAGDPSVQGTLVRHYQRRAADLITAAADPGAGERMRDVRRVLATKGHDLSTAAGRRSSIDYLFATLARVREEAAQLAADLEAARRAADATTMFAERSRIFRDRGLAGDSSVLTQFAVDQAVCGLRERGALAPGSVQRVAIVGPGLDFADKQEGFDFYSPQSLQPFTVADSLLRCGLTSRASLHITTLDISPRVNAHLRRAVTQSAYRLVFPWNVDAGWTDEAASYWKRAGDRIGTPFAVNGRVILPGLRARGIAVAPWMLRKLRPLEVSIVSDRLLLPERERFDLVLASNVLLYYDTFEQTLAAAAIAAMLRPGGALVTNDAVLEVPEIPMRSGGYLTVRFSDRDGDGERMVWYVRQADR
jgi:hypothetical protein